MAETNKKEKSPETSEKKESGKTKKSDELEISKKLLAETTAERDTLKSELDEKNDMYLRILAEYENYRNRTTAEKTKVYSDSVADTVEKFLPVLDNLDRACAFGAEGEDESIKAGIVMIRKSFCDILEKMGVSEIPSLGEQFDPSLHNAIMKEDNPDVGENVITEVFQKGYKYGDRVIRYSMVKVAN